MNICFYAPFKPLDHHNPSGDQMTAAGIVDYLERRKHTVIIPSRLRCRWIYWKPWLLPVLLREHQKLRRRLPLQKPDLWFTYHSYHKAPDLLGPSAAGLHIPYVIFQGIYATKRKKSLKTAPGFYLNRRALTKADHVFTNKKIDLLNLKRLLPEERITYVAPGIKPGDFCFDDNWRTRLRGRWQVGETPVVLSVAMFRPGVKADGLAWVIQACGRLSNQGQKLKLVIVGDGREKAALRQLADSRLPGQTIFTGLVPRAELQHYYSAADVFAFPGIDESLGMVYLEAQSCGLPVVAFDNAGVPQAVQHNRTGFLTPLPAAEPFDQALLSLIADPGLRREMGTAAMAYIRREHDLDRNYGIMEEKLRKIAWAGGKGGN